MIIEMLGCSKCQKAKADLELNCGHKLCQKCAKSYLFDGFVKKKWEKESITCPMNGCQQQLPGEWSFSCRCACTRGCTPREYNLFFFFFSVIRFFDNNLFCNINRYCIEKLWYK